MTDLPRYVLIVPADGDPHGLLVPGACRSSPPIVHLVVPGVLGVDSYWCVGKARGAPTRALPLVWRGAVVPEGVSRAKQVLARCVNLRGRSGLLWEIAGPVGNQYWILSSNGVARHFGRVEDEPPEVALAREVVARCGGRVGVSGD